MIFLTLMIALQDPYTCTYNDYVSDAINRCLKFHPKWGLAYQNRQENHPSD